MSKNALASLPAWMPRALTTLLLAVLVLGLALLTYIAMYLPKLVNDDTTSMISGGPATMGQVSNIDQNVQSVVPALEGLATQIPDLGPSLQDLVARADQMSVQLQSLQDSTAPLPEQLAQVQALGDEVAALREQLSTLSALADPLSRVADGTASLDTQLASLNGSAETIAGFGDQFTVMLELLGELNDRLASLDRKTDIPLLTR